MTWKYFFQLICFLWLMEPLNVTARLAKPGCKDKCGDITIPYPFGIGADCFLDEWFEVICHNNRSYLNKYHGKEAGREAEVLSVSLDDSTVRVSGYPKDIVCQDTSITGFGYNLSGTPFYYYLNKLIFLGCATVRLIDTEHKGALASCTSTCVHNTTTTRAGISGCEINIPFTQDFSLNFLNLEGENNSCGSFMVGKYGTDSVGLKYLLGEVSVPVVWRWTISEKQRRVQNLLHHCYDSDDYLGGYSCSCPDCTQGNPYLPYGCDGFSGDFYCSGPSATITLVVFTGTCFWILLLLMACLSLYKKIRKTRERKHKERFFKRMLRQQMSVDENIINKVRLFSSNELARATDYFNENRVLGQGGQGTVYKGMLADGRIVAIKKSKLVDKNQVEQFINEVVVLSQVNHRNVVQLLGCCLETDVPLLVYEFIPNGTLYDLIHKEKDDFLMSWDMGLRIASEVAGALAYLHSASSIPIYHRDIKSNNILLDEKYRAKVSDFGISKHTTVSQTHISTIVKGTFGYLDPEYFRSSQFTEKSDVYSFGVVLVELLTRQKPVSPTANEEESCLNLAMRFLASMEEDRLDMILHNQVLETANGEQVRALAKLAQCCLSSDGKERPAMKEVAMELESIIRLSHYKSSTAETNFQRKDDTEVELVVVSETSSSWATQKDTFTCLSDTYPLMRG